MRHEQEENYWHPSDRRRHGDRSRESPRHRDGESFNDFGSRWGEPDPRLNPRHQDWREEQGQERRDRRNPKDDWRPFEQQIENQRHQNRHYDERRQGRQQFEDRQWRERDRHFNSNNQHADDRWQNDNSMPHPDQDERRYYEDEQRRRHNRNYRED